MPTGRHVPAALAIALGAFASAPADGAPPPPLDAVRFSFPAMHASPASGASAGVGLADRWLGREASENPASAIDRSVWVTPQLVRVSRQDLRSQNSAFDEQKLFIDFAGLQIGLPVGPWSIALWGTQPGVRLENAAYTIGRSGTITGPPGAQALDVAMREVRAGFSLARAVGPLRLGASAEWTRRDDRIETTLTGGSPQAGKATLEQSGDAFGGAIGVRWERSPERPGGWVLGAAARLVPERTMEGTVRTATLSEDTTYAVQAIRSAVWGGGVSARVTLSPEAGLLVSAGGRGEDDWRGYGVTVKPAGEWRVGLEYHDAELPWTARFGVGQETQPGTPEPRAGSVGLGLGFVSGDTRFDVGVLRRSFERGALPTSFDWRVVGSVQVRF